MTGRALKLLTVQVSVTPLMINNGHVFAGMWKLSMKFCWLRIAFTSASPYKVERFFSRIRFVGSAILFDEGVMSFLAAINDEHIHAMEAT